MTRSVTCKIVNRSGHKLTLQNSNLDHGILQTQPPATIDTEGSWVAVSDGFMTGTQGWVLYQLDDGTMFEVDWDNPFIGKNSYSQGHRDPADPNSSTTLSLDGDNDDDATVTFTLEAPAGPSPDAAAGTAAPAAPPDPSAPHEVSANPGSDNQASTPASIGAPRLCVRLNAIDPSDTVGADTSFAAPNADGLTKILNVIATRLEAGIEDKVWTTDLSTEVPGVPGDGATNDWLANGNGDEERWARAYTELFLGTTYMGPGVYYGTSDVDVFDWFARETDPVVPIVAACQQLCSFAALSRGFRRKEDLGIGLSAGSCEGVTVFGMDGKGWHRPSTNTGDRDMTQIVNAIDKASLTPGSVYTISVNGERTGGPQTSNAHIAFVLRIHAPTKTAQFFDTGGLNGPGRATDLPSFAALKGNGNYDDPLRSTVAPSNYSGMGVLPAPPGALGDYVKNHLQVARPLGLARLALTTIEDQGTPAKTLFISRLLRMYGNATTQNFTIARYLWSLRKLPGFQTVQAWWLIYLPTGSAFITALRQDRSTLADLNSQKVPISVMEVIVLHSTNVGQAQEGFRVRTKDGEEKTEGDSPKPPDVKAKLNGLKNKWCDSYLDPTVKGLTLPPLFTDYSAPSDPTGGATT